MSERPETSWPTAITQIEPNHVRVRGYDLDRLMGRVSFGSMVYLVLRGDLPDESVHDGQHLGEETLSSAFGVPPARRVVIREAPRAPPCLGNVKAPPARRV